MSTLKVRLADAPTDVLVHLVDHGPATLADVAEALSSNWAPDVDGLRNISYALDLLRRMGLVASLRGHYQWTATREGIKAVRDARAAAERDGGRG